MTRLITAEEARTKAKKQEGMRVLFEQISLEIEQAASLGMYRRVFEPNVELCKAMYLEIAKVFGNLGSKVFWLTGLNQLIFKW